jgi:hypothetical protein
MNYDPILHEAFNGALYRQQGFEQQAQQSQPARQARLQAEPKSGATTAPKQHQVH